MWLGRRYDSVQLLTSEEKSNSYPTNGGRVFNVSQVSWWNKLMQSLVHMGKQGWGHRFDSSLIHVRILEKTILIIWETESLTESLKKEGNQLISQVVICYLCKESHQENWVCFWHPFCFSCTMTRQSKYHEWSSKWGECCWEPLSIYWVSW